MPLSLSNDDCYTALASRDVRFDGQFFVAVSSTRIYCRPICRVRLPARKNCQFFASAAAAESNGYRPCLRCRPELTSAWCTENISESLATQALHLLDSAFTETSVIDKVSARLGVSDRHLRRLLQQHVGVTPSQYIQTSRLLFAKQLLTDTSLPIGEVAMIAGFGSVRRFNATLKTEYGLTPSHIRKQAPARKTRKSTANITTAEGDGFIACRLNVVAPYDFQALLSFHAARAVPNLEVVTSDYYQRAVHIVGSRLANSKTNQEGDNTGLGWYRVSDPTDGQILLEVSPSLRGQLAGVLAIVRAQFDLDANPHHWLHTLGALAKEHPGLRVPGGVSGFELAVRAVVGQQISVAAATTILGRVVEHFGATGSSEGPSHVFPTTETLAQCCITTLGQLGIIKARAKAIQAIAQRIEQGELTLSPGADLNNTREALLAIPGVGQWTTNYILMRAVRWPDAFIDTDLGIIKAAKLLGMGDILQHAEQWRPWRAYAAMHLWQKLLAEQTTSATELTQ